MMKTLALIFAASLLSACGGSGTHGSAMPSSGSYAALRNETPAQVLERFKYVIVIVQENRSFDNMFHDFPGANSADAGKGHDGKTYTLQPIALKWPWVLNHSH